MLGMLARNWWMLLVRGFAAVLLGLAVIVAPPATVAALLIVLAAYLVVEGFFLIATAVTHRSYPRWWLTLLEGILGILAGIIVFLFPDAAIITSLAFAAAWAIITGVMEIVNAIELRKQIDNEWWLILSGVVSIIWGVVIIAYPGEALLTILWLFGGAAIVFGILMVLLAFRVRGMGAGAGTRAAA